MIITTHLHMLDYAVSISVSNDNVIVKINQDNSDKQYVGTIQEWVSDSITESANDIGLTEFWTMFKYTISDIAENSLNCIKRISISC